MESNWLDVWPAGENDIEVAEDQEAGESARDFPDEQGQELVRGGWVTKWLILILNLPRGDWRCLFVGSAFVLLVV